MIVDNSTYFLVFLGCEQRRQTASAFGIRRSLRGLLRFVPKWEEKQRHRWLLWHRHWPPISRIGVPKAIWKTLGRRELLQNLYRKFYLFKIHEWLFKINFSRQKWIFHCRHLLAEEIPTNTRHHKLHRHIQMTTNRVTERQSLDRSNNLEEPRVAKMHRHQILQKKCQTLVKNAWLAF